MYILRFILCLLLIGLFVHIGASGNQTEDKDGNQVVLAVVLMNGFRSTEQINISLQDNSGSWKEVYSEYLLREAGEEFNIFKVKLEKGKLQFIKIESPLRGVSISHGYLIHKNMILEVHISMKNEFTLITSDSLGYFD